MNLDVKAVFSSCYMLTELPLNFLGTIHADSEILKTIIEDKKAVDTME